MYGKGILKGLSVTFMRFWNTYWQDAIWAWRRLTTGKKHYGSAEGIAHRSSKNARGIFTVQYPEEKLPVPEEFRYIPFLVYDTTKNDEKDSADDVLTIKAFRDTWSLGIHSYLSYLQERLYLCRELLADSGSIFPLCQR